MSVIVPKAWLFNCVPFLIVNLFFFCCRKNDKEVGSVDSAEPLPLEGVDDDDPKVMIMRESVVAFKMFAYGDFEMFLAMEHFERVGYDLARFAPKKKLLDWYVPLVRRLDSSDDLAQQLYYPEDYDTQEERELVAEHYLETLKAAIELLKRKRIQRH